MKKAQGMTVLNFNQLQGACSTSKLTKILIFNVQPIFILFEHKKHKIDIKMKKISLVLIVWPQLCTGRFKGQGHTQVPK